MEIEKDMDQIIFYEEYLCERIRELSPERKYVLIITLLPHGAKPLATYLYYNINFFLEPGQATIFMLCKILVYKYDLVYDDVIIGFLLMINLSCQESPIKLDIVSFLIEMIHK